ncbi:hypothetical protein [Hafnia sp.]|uniref:hypothetical protein n=1 Tax=Hafnia sp. TaxID=1873498 RepID=UPI002FC94F51
MQWNPPRSGMGEEQRDILSDMLDSFSAQQRGLQGISRQFSPYTPQAIGLSDVPLTIQTLRSLSIRSTLFPTF